MMTKKLIKSKNKTVGITFGDPCGIGPEVIAKSLSKNLIHKLTKFVIIGSPDIFKYYYPKHIKDFSFINPIKIQKKSFTPGRPNKEGARAAMECLKEACKLLAHHKINALVTGPLSKESICSLGYKFQGHTEFLANYFKVRNFDMMFVANNLKTVIVTRHIPLCEISEKINTKLVLKTIKLTNTALKDYFRIRKPKIAICGLNPHAGERGSIGNEEIRKICPAIKAAQRSKVDIDGPFPADTIFYPGNSKQYDAIIAMYHDQGLTGAKALYFDRLVNLTIGLPFIRTSPAHGTAFNIAGKNKANPYSMEEAIKLAVQLSR